MAWMLGLLFSLQGKVDSGKMDTTRMDTAKAKQVQVERLKNKIEVLEFKLKLGRLGVRPQGDLIYYHGIYIDPTVAVKDTNMRKRVFREAEGVDGKELLEKKKKEGVKIKRENIEGAHIYIIYDYKKDVKYLLIIKGDTFKVYEVKEEK